MFEQLQGQQHSSCHRSTTTVGGFRKALGHALVNRVNSGGPGKGISPLAHRMGFGNKVCHLEARTLSAQPMLKITQQPHHWLS